MARSRWAWDPDPSLQPEGPGKSFPLSFRLECLTQCLAHRNQARMTTGDVGNLPQPQWGSGRLPSGRLTAALTSAGFLAKLLFHAPALICIRRAKKKVHETSPGLSGAWRVAPSPRSSEPSQEGHSSRPRRPPQSRHQLGWGLISGTCHSFSVRTTRTCFPRPLWTFTLVPWSDFHFGFTCLQQ